MTILVPFLIGPVLLTCCLCLQSLLRDKSVVLLNIILFLGEILLSSEPYIGWCPLPGLSLQLLHDLRAVNEAAYTGCNLFFWLRRVLLIQEMLFQLLHLSAELQLSCSVSFSFVF